MENNRGQITLTQKGSVLIVVLIIITAVVSLIIIRSESTISQYGEITSLHNTQQGYIYCISALKGVAKVLRQDKNTFDSALEQWASIPIIPIPSGYIRVVLTPLNSKVSIQNLTSKNESVRLRTEDAIKELLPEIQLSRLYEKLTKSPFYSLGALKLTFLPGVSNDLLANLTVETSDGRVNINFANKSVLKAYLPEIGGSIDELVKYRESKPFRDISQIRNVTGITDEIYLAIQAYITVEGSLFYIFAETEVYETRLRTSAIIEKKGGSIKILKYFEEAEEFYVS